MTLSSRDRRALLLLAVAVATSIVAYVALPGDTPAPVVAAAGDIPAAEKRLARVRQLAAAVPGKQKNLETARAERQAREQGLIRAETAAQAQARVLEVVRRAAKALPAPVEIRAIELGQIRPFGDEYGEALVSVSFECRIEDLVNLLAEISNQPELVATSELRIGAANAKEKTVSVRLTVSGLVPRNLVPEKKGLGKL